MEELKKETCMRKVVLYELQSLDGVAEEPGDWMLDTGPEIYDNLGAIIATQDDILLGRGTYDYWVGYWPTSDVEPFASFINGTRKHVFTSSTPAEKWENSTLVSRSAAEYVAELKQGAGGDVGIHGSIELARSLLREALVDELRLVVSPALAGEGRRLFGDDGGLQRLELLGSRQTAAGALLLSYRVVAQDRDSLG
jgi:dihydrofolate reductase